MRFTIQQSCASTIAPLHYTYIRSVLRVYYWPAYYPINSGPTLVLAIAQCKIAFTDVLAIHYCQTYLHIHSSTIVLLPKITFTGVLPMYYCPSYHHIHSSPTHVVSPNVPSHPQFSRCTIAQLTITSTAVLSMYYCPTHHHIHSSADVLLPNAPSHWQFYRCTIIAQRIITPTVPSHWQFYRCTIIAQHTITSTAEFIVSFCPAVRGSQRKCDGDLQQAKSTGS